MDENHSSGNDANNRHPQMDADICGINDWNAFRDYTITRLNEAISKIEEFWNALGLDNEGAVVRRQNLALQFKEFIEKYIDSERLHNHLVQKTVLDVAAQLEEMASSLNYNMPIVSDVTKRPMMLLDELNRLMVELSAEKNSRILRYNELISSIKENCNILDQHESIPKLNSFTKRFNGATSHQKSKYIPSSEELNVLDNYLNSLESEIHERRSQLETLRGSILDILLKIGRDPQDPRYAPLFNSKHQNLSTSFIDTVQRFHDGLMEENNDCKQKYDTLWKEIEYWWDKLDTELIERDLLRARYQKNYGYDTIQTLESIKENIIKERLSRIGQCIEKQRKILKKLLNSCYAFHNRPNSDLWGGQEVLDMAITKFDPKDVVMNTEAYLIRLETAVDVANQYYNDNTTLFNMIQRREQLWKELCTFESTPLTSERLKNRGGILLKEEKIRKRVYKELPALQQQLLIVIMDWKNKYKIENDDNIFDSPQTRTFYWEGGVDYTELLRDQWDNRIRFNKKLYHPDETISHNKPSQSNARSTPLRQGALERGYFSPRTPLTSVSSFSSNSTRISKATKRPTTPSTFLTTGIGRYTPFGSANKNQSKTPLRRDITLPKVPKLTFSSPIIDNGTTASPLLPLPNIPTNENLLEHKSKLENKKTPLRKPQLN